MATQLPTELELIAGFVNSADLEGAEDEFDSPDALAKWLRERRLLDPGARLDEADLRAAKELREGLRQVLRGHHDPDEMNRASIEELNDIAGRLPLHIHFDPTGVPHLVPAEDGVSGALTALLARIPEAMSNGTWERLKACSLDSCQWAFFDHSKNQSRRWCSMKTCGNKSKTRDYRSRQKSGG
jgi:predicted RNA-binding Zn ribbon-like protein